MKRAVEQMGVTRTARTLRRLNQVDGFDCQGCAWPDPDPEHRHTAEFCENGAKAVTEEATLRHLDRDFFAEHPMADLADKTDYWLGQQGRITEPMVLRAGATHYEPIDWDDAFAHGRGPPPRARVAGRGGVLHLRQDLQRGGVRLPAVRPGLRHQQPARLLEHVPRVHLRRPRRDDRHRQGIGLARGRAPGRADRGRSARTPAPTTRGCSARWRTPRGTAPGSSRSTRCARPGW